MYTEEGENEMSGRLKLKLSKKPRGEGYWAHLGDREEMSFDRVLEDAAKHSSFSPNMLKSAFETVMETMIEGTLKDGISRTAGDYFKLRLDVRGTFDSQYDYFDEDKHELALNLQVLKGLKRFAKPDLVERPYIPVVLETISNPGGKEGEIDLYKPILITGKRLKVDLDTIDEGAEDASVVVSSRGKSITDHISIDILCFDGNHYGFTYDSELILENDSSHILLEAFPVKLFKEMWDHEPRRMTITIMSCGGDKTARRQQHTIKAKILPRE